MNRETQRFDKHQKTRQEQIWKKTYVNKPIYGNFEDIAL